MKEKEVASVELDQLRTEVQELRDTVKSRETNLARSLGTAIKEYWTTGNLSQEAIFGVVNAFLFPRLVVVIGSVAAVVLGGLQAWLFIEQNTMMSDQNKIMRFQSEAVEAQLKNERIEAADALLASIDFDELDSVRRAIPRLRLLGPIGQEAILEYAETSELWGTYFRRMLLRNQDEEFAEDRLGVSYTSYFRKNTAAIDSTFASFLEQGEPEAITPAYAEVGGIDAAWMLAEYDGEVTLTWEATLLVELYEEMLDWMVFAEKALEESKGHDEDGYMNLGGRASFMIAESLSRMVTLEVLIKVIGENRSWIDVTSVETQAQDICLLLHHDPRVTGYKGSYTLVLVEEDSPLKAVDKIIANLGSEETMRNELATSNNMFWSGLASSQTPGLRRSYVSYKTKELQERCMNGLVKIGGIRGPNVGTIINPVESRFSG